MSLGENPLPSDRDITQTRESFDFQWEVMPDSVATQNTEEFVGHVGERVCQMTDLPPEWFPGKKVADVGCGAGRYTFGLLQLGSHVSALEQSDSALRKTLELNRANRERPEVKKIDLLNWMSDQRFDLVFCFGVVHHTGIPTWQSITWLRKWYRECAYS